MLKSHYGEWGGVSNCDIGWFKLDHVEGGYLHNTLPAGPKPEWPTLFANGFTNILFWKLTGYFQSYQLDWSRNIKLRRKKWAH